MACDTSRRRLRRLTAAMVASSWVVLAAPYLIRGVGSQGANVFTPFSLSAGTIVADETATYAPMVAQFLDHPFAGANPYMAGESERPLPLASPVAVALTGGFGLLGGGVHRAWCVSHLFWPFVSTLLLGLWVGVLTGDRLLGLVFVFFAVMANDLLTGYQLRALLGFPTPNIELGPLFYTRHVSPGVVLAVFASALLATTAALRDGGTWKPWAAGVLSGLLFYTYFFYWAVWLPALCVLSAYHALRRDRVVLRRLMPVLGITALFAVPWVLTYWEARHSEYFADFEYRFGVGRLPPSVLHHTLVLGGVALLGWKAFPAGRSVIVAVCLAGLVALNADSLPGLHLVQKEHFHAMFLKVFEVSLLLSIVWRAFHKRVSARTGHALLAALCTASLAGAFWIQVGFAFRHWEALSLSEDDQAVIRVIEHVTPESSIVFADRPELAARVLLYARRRAFIFPAAYHTGTLGEGVEKAALVGLLFGLTAQESERFVDYGFSPPEHRERHRLLLVRAVEERGKLPALRERYRLDYAVFSKEAGETPDGRLADLIYVTARGSKIYRVGK